MRESWRQMQVPIFGVVGILLIFIVIAAKLGVTTDEYAIRGFADIVPLDTLEGESCSTTLYDPVCCSDGITYDNLCFCKQAGVIAEYQGTCR